MWASAKAWLLERACQIVPVDRLKQQSRLFATALVVTFIIAVTGLVAVIFAYVDIHVWSKQTEFILVPQSQLVKIDGEYYIPIKVVGRH